MSPEDPGLPSDPAQAAGESRPTGGGVRGGGIERLWLPLACPRQAPKPPRAHGLPNMPPSLIETPITRMGRPGYTPKHTRSRK